MYTSGLFTSGLLFYPPDCCFRQPQAPAPSPFIRQQTGRGCEGAVSSLSTKPKVPRASELAGTARCITEEHHCPASSPLVRYFGISLILGGVWAKYQGRWGVKPRRGTLGSAWGPLCSHGPQCGTTTLLCTFFPGKIMDVHYTWRQNGWRSGQECWVSKSCRLYTNEECSEGGDWA